MDSKKSKISFATVGSKLKNGAFVKAVNEDDWELTDKRDKKSNKYYKCLKCRSQKEIRAFDRKTHKCI